MEQIRKPPLGTAPANVCATRRIRDLAGAINRTAVEYSRGDEYRIRNWAQEIIMQCDILRDLPSESRNRKRG